MPNTFATFAHQAALRGDLILNGAGEPEVVNRTPAGPNRRLANAIQPDRGIAEIQAAMGELTEAQIRWRRENARREAELTEAQLKWRRETARREAARAAMKRAWAAFGGPKASVGLPLDPEFPIEEIRDPSHTLTGYVTKFRGGTIDINPDGTLSIKNTRTVVNVRLVGLECQMRQEKQDEIYGVVAIIGPSGGLIKKVRIPEGGTLKMGPSGMRLIQLNQTLGDKEILQNYTIVAALVENDSGDVDVIAEKIASKIDEAARQTIGALTGAGAEAVGDSETFKENLATGLAWVFGDIFGMGDDPYNGEQMGIDWSDLVRQNPPLQAPVHRPDDAHVIEKWTHRLILSGVDDGDDRGQYALYFHVNTSEITETEQGDVPPAPGP